MSRVSFRSADEFALEYVSLFFSYRKGSAPVSPPWLHVCEKLELLQFFLFLYVELLQFLIKKI
jgi:hypothetical protein